MAFMSFGGTEDQVWRYCACEFGLATCGRDGFDQCTKSAV